MVFLCALQLALSMSPSLAPAAGARPTDSSQVPDFPRREESISTALPMARAHPGWLAKGTLVSGIVIFGGSFLAAGMVGTVVALFGAVGAGHGPIPALLGAGFLLCVPVVGPLIATFTLLGPGSDRAVLLADSAIQLSGLVLIAVGAVWSQRLAAERRGSPTVSVHLGSAGALAGVTVALSGF